MMSLSPAPVRRPTRRRLGLAATALWLSGCAAVAYDEPPEDSPAVATLQSTVTQRVRGSSSLSIMNFSPRGCFAGSTALSASRAMRLQPGREVFISYMSGSGDLDHCHFLLSFVPERGGVYRVYATALPGEGNWLVQGPRQCRLLMDQVLPDGSFQPVASTAHHFRVRPGCMRAVPLR